MKNKMIGLMMLEILSIIFHLVLIRLVLGNSVGVIRSIFLVIVIILFMFSHYVIFKLDLLKENKNEHKGFTKEEEEKIERRVQIVSLLLLFILLIKSSLP